MCSDLVEPGATDVHTRYITLLIINDSRMGRARLAGFLVASLGACRSTMRNNRYDCVLFSGTRWAVRSRPSTMSWHDANVSCTCSFTQTGRRALMPLVARRGSANKTLPMEVALSRNLLHFFFILKQSNSQKNCQNRQKSPR